MDWVKLDNENAIEQVKTESSEKPIVIFKGSTRCSISATALGRLEISWNKEEMKDVSFYYLDLLSFQPLSKKIAETFKVGHESPQILIISKGTCIYHASHMSISYQEIKNQISQYHNKN